jgi:cytochrome b pre-mRNA-processing protein 3
MFVHFSIFMIVFKKKEIKFNQSDYDSLFNNIENDLRELGFGDISVNKKMKELNKIMYDILLKIESKESNDKNFKVNDKLLKKYFNLSNIKNDYEKDLFYDYFVSFFNYCFAKTSNNMVEDSIKFKF